MTDSLDVVDRWWRAANYLSVGQIYLRDNPLLRRDLDITDVKPRLLGHWGTCPGINLLWAHLNRVLIERPRRTLFVCGPGHGGPAAVANAWLDGTYSELFPDISQDEAGMARLFERFSFPGGVPSHAAPETPGSMHEGGELGYSLAHAYGASFDAPGELVVCVIGDGEAESGPLAGSWQSLRFRSPGDGVVLPVLHLNGWKIANPTVLARLPESQLRSMLVGHGHEPWFVEGDEPADVHRQLADALDEIGARHDELDAASPASQQSQPWPMIVLRTPKGWTGPESVDGRQVEGHFRAHQVPIGHDLGADRLVRELDAWMRSYRPDELFDQLGAPDDRIRSLRPRAELRLSANSRANATTEPTDLELPPLHDHSIRILADDPDAHRVPGEVRSTGAMAQAGSYLREVIDLNRSSFRLFGPDEVESNRLTSVFDVTNRAWALPTSDTDVHLGDESVAVPGRVMEVLSEHLCQGWLEGYTLTGRHGVLTSYEAFVHIVDSMFNQHAKWLHSASNVEWRRPVPSFNYLLSSHVWRQDHNGFSHQDPGFLDLVANKKAEVVRIYLPPDANSLVTVLDHCLRSRGRINVIVAGKQPEPQYLTESEARAQLSAGASIWEWAGNEPGRVELPRSDADGDHDDGTLTGTDAGADTLGDRVEAPPPDVVLGCAGDVPTMETVAAAELLRSETDLVVRVVNVIDLMALQTSARHPHGLDDADYDRLFPPSVPTVFAFHGYPTLIHRLTYRRAHHDDLHVHGFSEEGTTTTPFDMAVRNEIDRFHLAIAAVEHQSPHRRRPLAGAVESWRRRLAQHHDHVRRVGDDLPAVKETRVVRADLVERNP